MRKTLLGLLLCIVVTILSGQNSTTDSLGKEYKNIIEVDGTGLLVKILSNNEYGYYYNGNYIITYRRIFKNNAIRFGAGGNIYETHTTEDDTITRDSEHDNLTLGLAYERLTPLNKRLTLFTGFDVLYLISKDIYNTEYPSSSSKRMTNNSGFGLSPYLGIEFKINPRISIAAETSLLFTHIKSVSEDIHTPDASNNNIEESIALRTDYNPPTHIFVRIKF